jgi:membrane protease YdiL (CAAX protease family)
MSIVVVSPLGESMWFQLVIQTQLERFGAVASILLTTAAFTLMHLSSLGAWSSHDEHLHLLAVAPGLLIFALIRYFSGSLGAVIVAHMTTNLVAFFNDPIGIIVQPYVQP